MRRCERYLKAGADGVFIPGIREAEELRRVGTAFRGTYQIVDMVEGKPPWLTPGELSALGFSQVVYPAHVMLRSMLAIESALSQLRDFVSGKSPFVPLPDVDRTRASFVKLLVRRRGLAMKRGLDKPNRASSCCSSVPMTFRRVADFSLIRVVLWTFIWVE
jgi:hypothetical protein